MGDVHVWKFTSSWVISHLLRGLLNNKLCLLVDRLNGSCSALNMQIQVHKSIKKRVDWLTGSPVCSSLSVGCIPAYNNDKRNAVCCKWWLVRWHEELRGAPCKTFFIWSFSSFPRSFWIIEKKLILSRIYALFSTYFSGFYINIRIVCLSTTAIWFALERK